MKIFFRTQFSSLAATAVDFLLIIFFVEILKAHYTVAVVFGAIAGALCNFFINRFWSFEASSGALKYQGFRYILVWTGSVLLNVGGVYLLTEFFMISYIFSKISIAVIVGLCFNYVLQKRYVFSTK